jgi:hypothetical protein
MRESRRASKVVFGVVLCGGGVEPRKWCLGWCRGGIARVGVLTLAYVGLLASDTHMCWQVDVSATTAPTRGRGQQPRCAVGRAAC